MIEAAFECPDLPQDENKRYSRRTFFSRTSQKKNIIQKLILIRLSIHFNSIHQTNLVEWVAKVYYASLGEMQRQSLRKGIYNALTKHYERVVGEDEDLGKRQKRGTIRWRKQKSS